MKAAIYARFSTDMQRDQSIDDQVRGCKKFITQEGWELVKIFSDKGLSGSKTDRPDYQAMLTAARAGKFDVIVCEDVSRLWRDEAEQARCVKELKYLERDIIGLNDGIDTRREGFEYLLAIKGAMNAGYRREIAKRTHRGQTGVVLNGKSAGGKAYGYESKYEQGINSKTGRPEMKPTGRCIIPEQAETIRQIYSWYAQGYSAHWIAAELNERGIPSPGSSWNRTIRRKGKWLASAVYGDMTKGTGILNNELYNGRLIWNRSRWVENPTTGKRERRERPKEEWVITDVPELRIVPLELWEKVKARQTETREKTTNLQAAMKNTSRAKYLFSGGMLKCGECGANFAMISYYQYGCGSHKNGGKHACSNGLRVSRKVVEAALLAGIKEQLFTPEAIDLFKRETAQLLADAKRDKTPDTTLLKADLAEAQKVQGNLVKAIEDGLYSEAVKTKLEETEDRIRRLTVALNADSQQFAKIAAILPRAVERYQKLVENLESMPDHHIPHARRELKRVLGEIKLIPHESGDYLEAEISGNFNGLVNLAANSQKVHFNGSGGRI